MWGEEGHSNPVPPFPNSFSPALIDLFIIKLFRVDESEWKICVLKLSLCYFRNEALCWFCAFLLILHCLYIKYARLTQLEFLITLQAKRVTLSPFSFPRHFFAQELRMLLFWNSKLLNPIKKRIFNACYFVRRCQCICWQNKLLVFETWFWKCWFFFKINKKLFSCSQIYEDNRIPRSLITWHKVITASCYCMTSPKTFSLMSCKTRYHMSEKK